MRSSHFSFFYPLLFAYMLMLEKVSDLFTYTIFTFTPKTPNLWHNEKGGRSQFMPSPVFLFSFFFFLFGELNVEIIWYENIFSALRSWYLSWTHWKCLIAPQSSQQEASAAGPLTGFCTTLLRSTFSVDAIHTMTQILYRETFTAKYSTQLMFGMLFIIISFFLFFFSLLSLTIKQQFLVKQSTKQIQINCYNRKD